jgi:hypothetical protein
MMEFMDSSFENNYAWVRGNRFWVVPGCPLGLITNMSGILRWEDTSLAETAPKLLGVSYKRERSEECINILESWREILGSTWIQYASGIYLNK